MPTTKHTDRTVKMPADLRLVRLLQLASPTLPVGAYSYSQALEAGVDAGIVTNAAGAAIWIADMLELSMCALEAPVLIRLHGAWRDAAHATVRRWNDLFLASRETAELRAETVQMGYSLACLLGALDSGDELRRMHEPAYPTAYAYAAVRWDIDASAALLAYLWAWLDNQVLAAVKLIPLGQSEGQRLLRDLGARIADSIAAVRARGDEDLYNFAPGLALLSSRHESQYSRLFRS
jgi:urease accessory protein